MLKIVLLAVGLIAAGAGSAPAQTIGTIQKLNEAWVEAFNKGDAAAIAAMYAEDAYVLPPGGEMVKGRKAIEGFWQSAMQQVANPKLAAVDVLPLGRNAAREIGTVTLQTKSQPPQPIVGKYAVVWRRIGGHWLLATDIWNTNK